MHVLNPYANRLPVNDPDDFFGRAEELRDLYQRIMQGQSVSLVGERRVGKSSLLNALMFEREAFDIPDDVRFVLLDMQALSNASEADVLERLFDLIEDETGVRNGGNTRDDIVPTVKAISKAGLRLVVMIDEFNFLPQSGGVSPGFYTILRYVATRHAVPFVVAYREGTVRELVKGLSEEGEGFSPFMNIFGVIYVGPLLLEDAKELVRRPAADSGVIFSDDEVEGILRIGGCLPFFLQIACYSAFERRRYGPLQGGWSEVEKGFRVEALHHLHHLWTTRFTPDEQTLLSSVGKRPNGLELVADERAAARLRQMGILVADGTTDRLFSSVFAEVISSVGELT